METLLDNLRPNPWQRLDSREVYRNPWIRVREDRVIRPGGAEGVYGCPQGVSGARPLSADDSLAWYAA